MVDACVFVFVFVFRDCVCFFVWGQYEMRLIVWKTKDVVPMDVVTGMNDLFVRCWMEGKKKKKQQTDCHYR